MPFTPRRAIGPAVALALFVLVLLLGARPAQAACPINQDCGPGVTHVTWTNTLTVTKSQGTVTSDVTGADGINCGTDCSGASRQTVACSGGDCADPSPSGWTDFVLTASGGPAGFSPSWSGCDSVSSGQCHVYLDADMTVSLNWVDTTDPVLNSLSVTNAASGRVGQNAAVTATASDNAAVSKVEWFIGSSPTPAATDSSAPYSATLSLAGVADGNPVTIRARATDTANRVSAEKTVTETVDKSVSETAGSVPAYTNAATVPVTISTDPDASQRCRTSGAQTIGETPCAGTYSPLTAASPDGAYTYTITATDAVGNVATLTRAFTLDRTVPAIANFDGPTEGSQVSTSSVLMSWDASDANLDAVTCKLDAAAAKTCNGSATLSGLADGTHRFTVVATDKAGNTSSKTRTFSVKTSTGGGGTTPGGGGTTPGGTTPAPGGTAPGTTTTTTTKKHRKANPARLTYGYALIGKATRLPQLVVRHAAKGSKISVRCKGPGCPKRKLVFKAKRSTVRLSSLQKRTFHAGAVLTIQVTKRGMKTKTVKITIRRGRAPKVR